MKKGFGFALLAAATFYLSDAVAQNEFPSPVPGKNAVGVVQMCLNAQGQAIPLTAAGQCAAGGGGVVTTQITDGLNGPVGVTPANTGPSAIQSALVVTMSPNSAFLTVNQGLLAGSAANSWFVQGNAASGVADSLNPIKVGGVFNTSVPTVSTGQRVDQQMSARGSALMELRNGATSITYSTLRTGITTPIGVSNLNVAAWPTLFNGTNADTQTSINGAVPAGTGTASVAIAPTSAATGGITPVVSTTAENNHVLKGSPGNLYSVYAQNQTATVGFLLVFNATSAPADGAVTPVECAALSASGFANINFGAGPPSVYSTGITAVVSSGANCFTKTTGVITAFFNGKVQ